MKNSIITASILATGLAFSGAANALTAGGTLNVSANVIAACTVTTTAVNFSNLVTNVTVRADGDVSVNCSNGIPYHIALDAGLNPAIGVRRMTEVAGTGVADYQLWLNNESNPQWGDSDYANTYQWGVSVVDTGSGSIQTHIVHGAAAANTFSPSGAYSDSVNVTVFY